jgi:hypothetical protein
MLTVDFVGDVYIASGVFTLSLATQNNTKNATRSYMANRINDTFFMHFTKKIDTLVHNVYNQ